MPSLIANGVRLHYLKQGDGPQTIVFSHSFALDSTHFEPQIRHFSERYRCIAFDHRGHGNSEVTRDGYEMENLYRDAVGFLDALQARGIGPVHFVGLSTGGFVGMRIAARRPDLLRSLVLMDTSARAEPLQKRIKYEGMFAVIKGFGFAPLRQPVLRTFFGDAFLDDPSRRGDVRRMWKVISSLDVDAAIAFGRGIFGRADVTDEIRSITVPTRVMVGQHDKPTPPARAREIAEAIAGAKLIVFPEAGHVGTIETPEVVNRELREFWDEVG